MKFEFSIDIPARRQLVWDVAQDAKYRQIWDPRVARYTVHGEPGEGVAASIVVRAFVLRPRIEARLTRFDVPRQSILRVERSTSRLLPGGGGTWLFEETPEGTRFTTRFNLKYEGRPPAPEWLISRAVGWDTRRSLRNLRKLVLRLDGGPNARRRVRENKALPSTK